MTNTSTPEAPRYPYEGAIMAMILLLFALGAVLEDKPTELRFRLAIPVVLLAAGWYVLSGTVKAGYLPTRRTTTRLRPDQKNAPGWTTVVIVIGVLILAPAALFS